MHHIPGNKAAIYDSLGINKYVVALNDPLVSCNRVYRASEFDLGTLTVVSDLDLGAGVARADPPTASP